MIRTVYLRGVRAGRHRKRGQKEDAGHQPRVHTGDRPGGHRVPAGRWPHGRRRSLRGVQRPAAAIDGRRWPCRRRRRWPSPELALGLHTALVLIVMVIVMMTAIMLVQSSAVVLRVAVPPRTPVMSVRRSESPAAARHRRSRDRSRNPREPPVLDHGRTRSIYAVFVSVAGGPRRRHAPVTEKPVDVATGSDRCQFRKSKIISVCRRGHR